MSLYDSRRVPVTKQHN